MILRPVLKGSACFIFLLILLFDSTLEIATISIVHDNAELTLLCLIDFLKPYDIGMAKDLKNFSFSQGISSFVLVHLLDVDLLNYCIAFIGLAFD